MKRLEADVQAGSTLLSESGKQTDDFKSQVAALTDLTILSGDDRTNRAFHEGSKIGNVVEGREVAA